MAGRIMRLMMGRYYRGAYLPVEVQALSPAPTSARVNGVGWRCVDLPLCQSVALQMIAAVHGADCPRRYFDFLMGFTYGAMYSRATGFLPAGVDPEIGLISAAPCLGLDRRYYVTDDQARLHRRPEALAVAGGAGPGALGHGCPVRQRPGNAAQRGPRGLRRT